MFNLILCLYGSSIFPSLPPPQMAMKTGRAWLGRAVTLTVVGRRLTLSLPLSPDCDNPAMAENSLALATGVCASI